MLRGFTVAALLVSAPALAQNFNFQMNASEESGSVRFEMGGRAEAVDHAGAGARPPGTAATTGTAAAFSTSSSTSREETDSYILTVEDSPDGRTMMKVLQPEGARCEVLEGKGKGAFEIPFTIRPASDRFYKYVVYLPNGQLFEKKLEVAGGKLAKLYVKGPLSSAVYAPPPAPAAPPPVAMAPMAPPSGPMPMPESEFEQLLAAIDGESFPEQRLGVVETAASSAYFSVAQVARMVDLMSFPNNKVDVVRLTLRRIVDRQNGYQLYSHFDFPNDKAAVKAMLSRP